MDPESRAIPRAWNSPIVAPKKYIQEKANLAGPTRKKYRLYIISLEFECRGVIYGYGNSQLENVG